MQNPPGVHVWSSSSCLMLLRSRFLNDSCCSWSTSIPWQWRLELDNPSTSIWNKLILFACGSNAIPHIDRQSAWEGGRFMNFQCVGLVWEIVTLYVEQVRVHTYLKKHHLLWQVFFFFSIANIIVRSFSCHAVAGLWTCKQSTVMEDHHFHASRMPFMGLGAIFLTFFCIGRWKKN